MSWHDLSELFERTVEPGADRTRRTIERLGDLDVGKADVELEDDRSALIERLSQ
jgi:hypothetical protein